MSILQLCYDLIDLLILRPRSHRVRILDAIAKYKKAMTYNRDLRPTAAEEEKALTLVYHWLRTAPPDKRKADQ